MTAISSARIFISYSRKDGAVFAAKVRHDLETRGFSIWQDLIALEGGRDWWSQIEDVVRSQALQHFILVVTPAALTSPIIRREIRLARQEGKTFCPVRGPGLSDLGKLPRWLGQIYDLNLAEQRNTLERVLKAPNKANRVPMMAPEPPADFVKRPIEFDALKKQLLDTMGDAVAITAALRGAGGYGKTTLARALAHDPDILDAYFDGILWVELGERPASLLAIISDLVSLLSGTPRALDTLNAAATALAEAVGDRRILLIVDDVWREQDLRPFLHGGPNMTRLITTRLDRVVPANAFRQFVDAMSRQEAFQLLTWGLPEEQVRAQEVQLAKLSARLGNWALLLKLANGFLGWRQHRAHETLERAIASVNRRLDERGLTAFDANNEDDRSTAVARTMGISLDLLGAPQRERFAELGVFPEDTDVPIGIIARLWAQKSGIDEVATEDLLGELLGLSLVLNLDLDGRTVRLHDTVRQFLRDQSGKESLAQKHAGLIAAMEDIRNDEKATASEAYYFYRYLPEHLHASGAQDKLDALLLDPGWLKCKLAATGNPQALVADYEQFSRGQIQNRIGRTLRLTTAICARDQRQLLPQLLGRLDPDFHPLMANFLESVRSHVSTPALLLQGRSLAAPGAEIARIELPERKNIEWMVAVPDGRVATACFGDAHIEIWDLRAEARVATLGTQPNKERRGLFVGLRNEIRWMAARSDGKLLSYHNDGKILVWDLEVGKECDALDVRGRSKFAVLVDGSLALADSHSIEVWSWQSRRVLTRMERHENIIEWLAPMPDGCLALGYESQIILWNVTTSKQIGHTMLGSEYRSTWVPDPNVPGLRSHRPPPVKMVSQMALSGGRLAIGCSDGVLRVWDLRSGDQTASLEGHAGPITAMAALPDSRLASASDDRTIRLWNVSTSAETGRFIGHHSPIRTLVLTPDARLASTGYFELTIRLWDVSAASELSGGQRPHDIVSIAVLPDGSAAVAFSDNEVRVWDQAGDHQRIHCEQRARPGRISLVTMPDGRLAICPYGRKIQFWKPASRRGIVVPGTSQLACVLSNNLIAAAYQDEVLIYDACSDVAREMVRIDLNKAKEDIMMGGVHCSLCAVLGGQLAVYSSFEGCILFLDAKTGSEVRRIDLPKESGLPCLAMLADGRLASGVKSIRLLNLDTGEETARLDGHADAVSSLAVVGPGRLASGGLDKTIRLWDTGRATEMARLEIDAAVSALAVLPDGRLIAGDKLGRLHWLQIVSQS